MQELKMITLNECMRMISPSHTYNLLLILIGGKGIRMKVLWWKATILGLLVIMLVCLLFLKIVVGTKDDWVVIEEKYFPLKDGHDPLGIKSGEKLDPSQRLTTCAMKFDDGHTYSVDCDEYLDYNIGEKVRIVPIEKNQVKLRRK